MKRKKTKILRGMTWKHDRGLAPLVATASRFREQNPEVMIEWETRSLQEFGESSIRAFAERYDMVVIDHPFLGEIARENCFLPLDEHFRPAQLSELNDDSVGPSYLSYCFAGHQWALPVDAAGQVAGYRADLLKSAGFKLPQTWEEVLEMAKFRRGFVSLALFPLDALMCFFSLCANQGEPPFSRGPKVVGKDIGQQALERLHLLAEHSVEEALALNPIAIWEHMSSSDEIAYCPLAFGYSNYARNGYRSRLISFGPIPSGGRGPVGATLGGTGLAISKKCAHPDLALAYALWVTGKECQRTLYVESGGQPASKAAWLDAHANKLTNGYFAATLAVLENAWLRPRSAGFERFQVAASEPIREFLTSKRSCSEVLERLDELYDNTADNQRLFNSGVREHS
jgi:multiple sugar transport system substrate-binding protein